MKTNERKKDEPKPLLTSSTRHRALLRNSQTPDPKRQTPDPTQRRPGSLSRSILGLFLLLLALPVRADITVTGRVDQITADALETYITFTPGSDILVLANGLSAGPAKTIWATNGNFSTILRPGTYLTRLPLISGRNAFTIAVPTGTGTENITNLIAAPWTYQDFVNTVSTNGGSSAVTAAQLATASTNSGTVTISVATNAVNALIATQIAATTNLMSSLYTNWLWVAAADGDDDTGARGNPDLPYLTIAAAEADSQGGDIISIRRGRYLEDSLGADGITYLLATDCVVGQTNITGPIFTAPVGIAFRLEGNGFIEAVSKAIDTPGGTGSIYLNGITITPNSLTNNVTGNWLTQ